MRLAVLQMRDGKTKASMHKSGWFAAATTVFGLMAMPPDCLAAGKSVGDPGAFAALGTIYFSSVLDESGIGSGHSGGRSPGGGGAGGASDGFTENLAQKSDSNGTRGPWGGTPILGDIDPASGSGGSDSDQDRPGNNAPDRPVGLIAGADGGDSSGPSANVPGSHSGIDPSNPIWSPPTSQGPSQGSYWPDEILSDQGGLLLPEGHPVASSVRIVQVPEPTSVALFGAGLLGLGLVSRRRRAVA
jgi:hypothetical protein